MDSFFIRLIEKKQLTHDVLELIYSCEEEKKIIPGQFLLCDTDTTKPSLRRSYSVSLYRDGKIHFIIKELHDGKGGSRAICQQSLGHTMQVWGPMGNFVLPSFGKKTIIFIGTGTGFAPLYFQAQSLLKTDSNIHMVFVFGVRTEADIFYKAILEGWTQKYPHFSYKFCLSQGKDMNFYTGRVTEYIRHTSAIVNVRNIYSICGSPAMVREVRDLLSENCIPKEQIFFEQY